MFKRALFALIVIPVALAADPVVKHAVQQANGIQSEMNGLLAPCDRCKLPIDGKNLGRNTDIPIGKVPLFQDDSLLEITVKSDFPGLTTRDKATPETPGLVTYRRNDHEENVPVLLGTRGHSKQAFCATFKPLRLGLDKEKVKGTLFEHAGKDMKLATHCLGMGDFPLESEGSQLAIREYGVLRMLEAMGLPSFKARLVHATYLDNAGKQVASGYGFFLEPSGAMAKRLGYDESVPHPYSEGLAEKKLPPWSYSPAALAQFNLASGFFLDSDHFPAQQQNVVPVMKDGKVVNGIPYDFDQTYFVRKNGNWAIQPDPDRDRNVIVNAQSNGDPATQEIGRKTVDQMIANKDRVYSVARSLPLLDADKDRFLKRLDLWYAAIDASRKNKPVDVK
jgi:hypothetical protein